MNSTYEKIHKSEIWGLPAWTHKKFCHLINSMPGTTELLFAKLYAFHANTSACYMTNEEALNSFNIMASTPKIPIYRASLAPVMCYGCMMHDLRISGVAYPKVMHQRSRFGVCGRHGLKLLNQCESCNGVFPQHSNLINKAQKCECRSVTQPTSTPDTPALEISAQLVLDSLNEAGLGGSLDNFLAFLKLEAESKLDLRFETDTWEKITRRVGVYFGDEIDQCGDSLFPFRSQDSKCYSGQDPRSRGYTEILVALLTIVVCGTTERIEAILEPFIDGETRVRPWSSVTLEFEM